MSKIGQPELRYLRLNFSNFRGVTTITQTILSDLFQTLGIGSSLGNAGQV